MRPPPHSPRNPNPPWIIDCHCLWSNPKTFSFLESQHKQHTCILSREKGRQENGQFSSRVYFCFFMLFLLTRKQQGPPRANSDNLRMSCLMLNLNNSPSLLQGKKQKVEFVHETSRGKDTEENHTKSDWDCWFSTSLPSVSLLSTGFIKVGGSSTICAIL